MSLLPVCGGRQEQLVALRAALLQDRLQHQTGQKGFQLLVPGMGPFAHLIHIVRGVQEGSEASPWPWDGGPGDEG